MKKKGHIWLWLRGWRTCSGALVNYKNQDISSEAAGLPELQGGLPFSKHWQKELEALKDKKRRNQLKYSNSAHTHYCRNEQKTETTSENASVLHSFLIE